jgi:hypothetical protein
LLLCTCGSSDKFRAARWYILDPKISIWVNLEGPFIRRCWFILWTFGVGIYGHLIFLGRLEYFVVIWYIFPRFGMLYREKPGNPADNILHRQLEYTT